MQTPSNPRNYDESFGQTIASIRGIKGLSQRELSERLSERGLSIDPSAISRIEQGSRALKLAEALVIADVLDVDLPYLLEQNPTPEGELKRMRRHADFRRTQAREPLINLMNSHLAIEEHLTAHPELLESLSDDDFGSPARPEDYFSWVLTRIRRLEGNRREVDDESFAWAVDAAAAERVAKFTGEMAALFVEVDVVGEATDGEHPEAP